MFEFIVATHDDNIFKENIVRSNVYANFLFHKQVGFTNVPEAYNDASKKIRKDHYAIYCHHDIYFPTVFEFQLTLGLKYLENIGLDWGVIGVAGVRLEDGVKKNYGHINDRGRVWGDSRQLPARVQTLDEMLLITKGDLIFDPQFEQDFYGADICMQANRQGRDCYAINAFCHHNSGREIGGRTESFYKSEALFREKWKHKLPIVTTTSLML